MASGKYYWRVKVPEYVAVDGEIYLHADEVGVYERVLWMTSNYLPILVLSEGNWYSVNQASVMDGSVVNVEHWNEYKPKAKK